MYFRVQGVGCKVVAIGLITFHAYIRSPGTTLLRGAQDSAIKPEARYQRIGFRVQGVAVLGL